MRLRVVAACAAIVTAILVQVTVVTPLTPGVQVSLPAVLVCAVALVEGPGVGIAFGFSTGLVADLASSHPAGVLALSWLVMGTAVGMLPPREPRPRHRLRRLVLDALRVAAGTALGSLLSVALLVVLRSGGTTAAAFIGILPAATFNGVLALALLPLVRLFLSSPALRPARPALAAIDLRSSRV